MADSLVFGDVDVYMAAAQDLAAPGAGRYAVLGAQERVSSVRAGTQSVIWKHTVTTVLYDYARRSLPLIQEEEQFFSKHELFAQCCDSTSRSVFGVFEGLLEASSSSFALPRDEPQPILRKRVGRRSMHLGSTTRVAGANKKEKKKNFPQKSARRAPRPHPTSVWVKERGKFIRVSVKSLWAPNRYNGGQGPVRVTLSATSDKPTELQFQGLARGANTGASKHGDNHSGHLARLALRIRHRQFYGAVGGSPGLTFQGPALKGEALRARQSRDEKQRAAAAKARRKEKLSIPKEWREHSVKARRDVRNPTRYLLEQTGGSDLALKVSATLGAATMAMSSAYGLYKAYKFLEPAMKLARHVNENVGDDASEIVGKAKLWAESIAGGVNDISDFGSSISNFFKSIKSSLEQKLGPFWQAVAVVASVWLLMYLPQTALGHVARAAVIAVAGKALGIWSKVVEDCPQIVDFAEYSKHFDSRVDGHKLREQAGPAEILSKVLATSMLISSGWQRDRSRAVSEIMKALSNLPRMADGWECLIDWVTAAFDYCINFIMGVNNAEGKRVQLLSRVMKGASNPAVAWMEAVNCTMQRLNTESTELARNEAARKLLDLVNQSHMVCNLLGPNTSAARKIAELRKEVVSAIMGRMPAIKGMQLSRQEPSFLIMRGPPGNGKSYMLNFLAYTLLGKAFPKEPISPNSVWTKGTGTEYYNGYAGQPVVIHDEMFQKPADATDAENDFLTMLREINSCAMPLNYADVMSKGLFFFEAKLVIATTNVQAINSDANLAMRCPEALIRRFHFPLEIEWVGPEGRNVSTTLIAPTCQEHIHATGGEFPYHFWKVRRWDYMDGVPRGDWQSLKDIIPEIAAHIARNRKYYEGTEEARSKFMANLQPKEEKSASSAERQIESATKSEIPLKEQGLGAVVATASMAAAAGYCYELWDYYATSNSYSKVTESLDESLGTWCESFSQLDPEMKSVKKFAMGFTTKTPDSRIFNAMAHTVVTTKNIILKNMEADLDALRARHAKTNKILAMLCLAGVAGYVTHSVVKYILKSFAPTANELVNQSDSASRPISRNVLHSQSAGPLLTGIQNNTWLFTLEQSGGRPPQKFGYVLFITKRVFVMPKHFMFNIRELESKGLIDSSSVFRFQQIYGGAEKSVSFDYALFKSCRMHEYKDKDLCIVDFSTDLAKAAAMVRQHKRITHLFPAATAMRNLYNKNCRLDLLSPEGGKLVRESKHYASFFCDFDQHTSMKYNIEIGPVLKYSGPITRFGDCGAPFSLEEDKYNGHAILLGIHVAVDDQDVGCAIPISKEDIVFGMGKIGVEDKDPPDMKTQYVNLLRSQGVEAEGLVTETEEFWHKGPSFTPLLEVDGKLAAHLSPKTKLFKTSLGFSEPFGPFDRMPAMLGPKLDGDGTLIEPMRHALDKYGMEVTHKILPQLWRVAAEAYRPLLHAAPDHPSRVLTFEEAVLGVPDLSFKSIPRGTSAGYPYTIRKDLAKKTIFGDAEEYNLNNPFCDMLRARVAEINYNAEGGERMLHIFTDALKDELRTSEKATTGQTRLLSCSPLCLTISTRMYFGCFMAAFMSAPISTAMAPGINVFKDWPKLQAHLNSKGGKVLDGDFKALDATEVPIVQNCILEMIEQWYKSRNGADYKEEHATARRTLFMELTNSRHIGGDGRRQSTIYEWHKSLPSGHPLTTVVNSMYCLLVIAYTYFRNCPRIGRNVDNFWNDAAPAVFGDDHVVGVRVEAREVLNQTTLADVAFSDFSGMVYTSADKHSSLSPELQPLHHVKFLQRSFPKVTIPGEQRLCPLELERFLNMNYWCANRKLMRNIMRDNWEIVLLELSLHSKEVWDKHAGQVFAMYKQSMAGMAGPKSLPRIPICDQSMWRYDVLQMDNPW